MTSVGHKQTPALSVTSIVVPLIHDLAVTRMWWDPLATQQLLSVLINDFIKNLWVTTPKE